MRHHAGKSEIRIGGIVVAAFHKKGTPLTGPYLCNRASLSIPASARHAENPPWRGALIAEGRDAADVTITQLSRQTSWSALKFGTDESCEAAKLAERQ